MTPYEALANILKTSKSTVFFGGAGTSTESNVPDFRSKDGLYQIDFKGIKPEEVLSRDFFFDHTDLFYTFLKTYLIKEDIKPHFGHHALVTLEKRGLLDAIITQNIDNLHQAAGSKKVYELHGSLSTYHCVKCHSQYQQDVLSTQETLIPKCRRCDGILKPNVVLYQEGLDDVTVRGAIKAISNADVLIICGTSLVVYPAAGFLQYFRGRRLVLINRDETSYDQRANLKFNEAFGHVFRKVMPYLEG